MEQLSFDWKHTPECEYRAKYFFRNKFNCICGKSPAEIRLMILKFSKEITEQEYFDGMRKIRENNDKENY